MPPENKDQDVVDDVFRAGADPIEAEDLSAGYDHVFDDNGTQLTEDDHVDPEASPPEDKVPTPEAEPEATPPEGEKTPVEAEATPEGDKEPQPAEPEAEPGAKPEGEPDAQLSPEPDAGANDTPAEPTDKHMIPKSRFDQETAKRRAAENRLREIQTKMEDGTDSPQQTRTELEALEMDLGDKPKEMFDKILDGQLDAAGDIFKDLINKSSTAAAQAGYAQARKEMDGVITANTQAVTEADVIASLETDYDFYNPAHADFSADAIAETVALQQGFISQGYTPADAMQTAANYYLKMHTSAPVTPEPVVPAVKTPAPVTPAAEPAPDPAAIQRNLDARGAQPPAIPTTSGNETVTPELPDISRMSVEDIEALPESTIKRLRGDYA